MVKETETRWSRLEVEMRHGGSEKEAARDEAEIG